jgi:hypothetical protein
MRIATILFLAFAAVGCGGNKNDLQRRPCSQTTQQVVAFDTIPKVDIREHHDAFHVVVFSYQNRGPKANPAQCHTFATWVHTRNKQIVDQVDISWCPQQRDIRVVINDVPGRNKCLASTLDDAKSMRLAYWVMRTDKTFFDAAMVQKEKLTMYRALDSKSRPIAVNCIHACSDVAGNLNTGIHCGISAGQMVSDFYVRSGKAWSADDPWIIPLIMRTNNCKIE